MAATSLIDTEALARILLRAESVASSRIEGLEVGARRLPRAEAVRDLGEAPSDVTALEVLGNIDAMVAAIRSADEGEPITIDLLLDLHRRLLTGTRLEAHGGRLREIQNWIGGIAYNPCSAAFVPAPPEMVEQLMVDLVAFANGSSLPPVASRYGCCRPSPSSSPPGPRTTSAVLRPAATGAPRRRVRPTRAPTCGSGDSPGCARAPLRTRTPLSTEAPDIIDAFTDLERQLGSPAGDTRASEPVRRVPYRRQK